MASIWTYNTPVGLAYTGHFCIFPFYNFPIAYNLNQIENIEKKIG